MQMLRSYLYALYFYGLTVLLVILWLPFLLLGPRSITVFGFRLWGWGAMKGLKAICGTGYEIRGLENLPADKPVLIAAKHQSAWDIVALFALVKNPAFVSKVEIAWIPIAGFYAMKVGTILVNRGAAAKALRDMVKDAEKAAEKGRSIVIFPEGTRAVPGAAPDYKPGIAALYTKLGLPCVPVALNSGVFWPRRQWRREKGTIVIEFLPAIEPGLKRKDFMGTLEASMEPASGRLLEEARSLKA